MKKIGSIIFLVWFFGSIFMMHFLKEDTGSIAILFGQIFFIIGLFASKDIFKNRQDNYEEYAIILFPTIGFVVLTVGIFLKLDLITFDLILPFIAIPLFIFVGLILIILSLVKYINKRVHCTEEVTGTVIDFSTRFNESRICYSPIYEVHYGGVVYKLNQEIYNYRKKYELGEDVEIKIDPDNPRRFISPNDPSSNLILLFFGLCCIIGGLLPMYFIFFANQ